MKTDLASIKEKLRQLTDLDRLKAELGKMTGEIKNFDLNIHLAPQARSRLKTLEKRFHEVRKRLVLVQKQVDGEVNKFIKVLRRDAGERLRSVGLAGRKKTGKKASRKSTNATSVKKGSRKTGKA